MKFNESRYNFTGTKNVSIQNLLKGFDDRFEKLVKEIHDNTSSGDKALDIGCGEGKIWQLFPDLSVTGLDMSRANLKKANKYIKTVFGDAQKLPFRKKSFNFVVASEILEHLLEPDKTLLEIYRVLKVGGRAVITFPNTGSLQLRLSLLIWGRNPTLNYPDNPVHVRFFDLSDIKYLLRNTQLTVKKVRGGNFLSFHKVNFRFYLPIPKLIRYVGGDLFPALSMGSIVVLEKVG